MRVLIATVTAGGGHLQAAAALEEAWRSLRPADELERVDLLDFVPRLQRDVYVKGYTKLVEHAPQLWGLVFHKTDNPALVRKLTRFRRAYAHGTNVRFARHLKRFAPDIVLCTHYLPLEICGHLAGGRDGPGRGAHVVPVAAVTLPAKSSLPTAGRVSVNSGRTPAPLTVCVVTDFEAHALWMDSCVDLYCVAAEETKARLVARGAAAENVIATGIPISGKFSDKPDAHAVRQALGLRNDQPVLLVLGGGFGMGPVAEILAELDKVERQFQTLVVAGRNEGLRRELAGQDRRHPTRVLGFVTNMHELMAVADLIITKPGGLTSSEALALGKPLCIINPIPGQEAANSDFLLQHGAAMKINCVEDLPYRVEQLLGSKKLAQMARAARALGKPGAAREICRAAIERMSLAEAAR